MGSFYITLLTFIPDLQRFALKKRRQNEQIIIPKRKPKREIWYHMWEEGEAWKVPEAV